MIKNLLEILGINKQKADRLAISVKKDKNLRASYRIEYYEKDMPVVEIARKKYKVINISTNGLKLSGSGDFYKNQSLDGKIQTNTYYLNFSGKVIRVNKQSNCTAIKLYNEVGFERLSRERNYLKNEKGYKI